VRDMSSGIAIPLAFTVPQELSSKIKYLEPTSVGFLFFFKNTCTTYPRLCIIHLFSRLITKGVGMKAQVIYKIINLTNGNDFLLRVLLSYFPSFFASILQCA